MTLPSLLWWSLPLAALPWLVQAESRGRVMARLVIAGFALGALHLAIGGLTPAELSQYASIAPGNSLFVSLTVGLLVGAFSPWPPPLSWVGTVTALPLILVSIGATLSVMNWGGLLLGIVLGALPVFAGAMLPVQTENRDPDLRAAAPPWWIAATLAVALAEPLVIVVLLPLPWLVKWRRSWLGLIPTRRILPAVAFVLLVILVWLATTVAGSPWVKLSSYATAAPLSIGAERLLAVLGIGALTALLSPWPLSRLGPLLTPLPAIVVLAYRFATSLAPQGIEAWFPATAMVLVPSALIAILRGQWRTGLGTIAVLAALTGTTSGAIGAGVVTLMAIWPSLLPGHPALQNRFFEVRRRALVTALGLALSIAAILSSEVVMATCLAAGCAVALARRVAHPTA